jgi:hypothetical protein
VLGLALFGWADGLLAIAGLICQTGLPPGSVDFCIGTEFSAANWAFERLCPTQIPRSRALWRWAMAGHIWLSWCVLEPIETVRSICGYHVDKCRFLGFPILVNMLD